MANPYAHLSKANVELTKRLTRAGHILFFTFVSVEGEEEYFARFDHNRYPGVTDEDIDLALLRVNRLRG